MSPVSQPEVSIFFYDKEQRKFGEVMNSRDYLPIIQANGMLEMKAIFPAVEFGQGIYSLTIRLSENSDNIRKIVFRVQSAIHFRVLSKIHGWAPMQFTPKWELESEL